MRLEARVGLPFAGAARGTAGPQETRGDDADMAASAGGPPWGVLVPGKGGWWVLLRQRDVAGPARTLACLPGGHERSRAYPADVDHWVAEASRSRGLQPAGR